MGAIDRHNSGKRRKLKTMQKKIGSWINNYSSTSIEEHQAESKKQRWWEDYNGLMAYLVSFLVTLNTTSYQINALNVNEMVTKILLLVSKLQLRKKRKSHPRYYHDGHFFDMGVWMKPGTGCHTPFDKIKLPLFCLIFLAISWNRQSQICVQFRFEFLLGVW